MSNAWTEWTSLGKPCNVNDFSVLALSEQSIGDVV
jgi:hypothetical protein